MYLHRLDTLDIIQIDSQGCLKCNVHVKSRHFTSRNYKNHYTFARIFQNKSVDLVFVGDFGEFKWMSHGLEAKETI